MGYHRAGFDVTGVDIAPQKRYPFAFVQSDALEYLRECGHCFDVIHASPPCHDHTPVTGRNRKAKGLKGTGWMLAAAIELLQRIDSPWIVENVEGASMPPSAFVFRLCGSSFGLDVRRHRLFASNVFMMPPQCAHFNQAPRFRSLDSRRPVGSLASVVGVHGHLNYPGEFDLRCKAMGIDWMNTSELSQAIPPAYTEWIGRQLIEALA